MSTLSGTALGDYGHPVFQRDGFVCVYCGFDGNGFHQWRQLSVDHLRPADAGGTDSSDNLVTACNFCNSATSRMKFSPDQSANEILALKKQHVADRLKSFYKFWWEKVAPRDTALTPEQGGIYLTHPLVLDLRAVELTDEQLARISSDNSNLRLELTAKGELVIMPPTGGETGWQENELCFQVTLWARQDGAGITFGPSVGFRLPNGAVLAPDVSWIPRDRWESLTEDERKGFPPVCPDFVLELRSQSDTLASCQEKMDEYMENGVRLGWLVDPFQRRVHIYRPGTAVEVLDDPATVPGETVLPGFELNVREIW